MYDMQVTIMESNIPLTILSADVAMSNTDTSHIMILQIYLSGTSHMTPQLHMISTIFIFFMLLIYLCLFITRSFTQVVWFVRK